MHLKVLPINALGKYMCTRVTKFFHIDSIGTQQQCKHRVTRKENSIFLYGFFHEATFSKVGFLEADYVP